MRNPLINEQNKEPMNRRIKHGECKIARGLNGLNTAREAENDSSNLAAPAVRCPPTLQAAFDQSRAVQPQIYQKDDCTNDPGKKQRAGCPCRGFQLAGGLTRMTARLK